MNINFLKKFFKPKYPYAPIAFMGRKAVERSLSADIVKYKKLQDEQENAQQESTT